MRTQIRRSVYETNSSMMHAMVIADEYEYEQFKNGELNINMSYEMLTDEPANNKNILTYHEFIHYFDSDPEYDMCTDAEEFPPPGTIEKNGELYNIHYQWD